MCCDHQWVHKEYCRICIRCGVQLPFLKVDRYNKYSAPLQRGYDRCGRFKTKLDKLYGRHSGPKSDDAIWTKLDLIRYKLRHPNDIRKVLRKFKIANKHYDCIRIFSDVFTTFRVKITNPLHQYHVILDKFRKIHSAWSAFRIEQQFFSYDYLLRHLLDELKSPLVIYCKPQTNKRRRSKYKKKLNLIRARSADKMYYHRPAEYHFHYVSMQPSIRQYLQYVAEGPSEQPVEGDSNHNVDQMGCLVPYPPNNSGKLQGGNETSTCAFVPEQKEYQVDLPSLKDSDEDICASHHDIVSAYHLASLKLLLS